MCDKRNVFKVPLAARSLSNLGRKMPSLPNLDETEKKGYKLYRKLSQPCRALSSLHTLRGQKILGKS